ncbi:MAG: hypothetical protein IID17_14895 [Nitrospinae bacterium]|nr:hypothetical protein [Nitrospinota bacterium]
MASPQKTILDLCSGTGAWSAPYREAGYNVISMDLPNDIRLMEKITIPVHGILAGPPCDHLASSGARWWKNKGEKALLHGLSIVDACLRMVAIYNPIFWVLENPVGRLVNFLGTPYMYFNPCDYGDTYTKKTCLWGDFNIPKANPVLPLDGSKMHLMSSTQKRERSRTPDGFARAFFKENQ